MAGIKKDNHYVPQAYLRRWQTGNQILTYRLLVPHENWPHWKVHSPKSIAKLQHLYTYFSGSQDSDEIEHWLDSDFEQPGLASIAKVVKEAKLNPEDWQNLFRFALAQSVRTPTGLERFLKRQDETLEKILESSMGESVAKFEAAQASGTKFETPPAVDPHSKLPLKLSRIKNDDGSESIQAKVLSGRKFWIWQLEHILKNTVNRMPALRWTILHAPAYTSWPTTDNPLTRIWDGPNGKLSLEGGWGVPGTKIFLPLSPKHLLFAQVGQRPPRRGTVVSLHEAAYIRTMILYGASRYVFSTDTHDIAECRPRTVSQKQFDEERKRWADWHVTQSEEEANYPNL
ncbi:DUF4238 domain-containing protein [Pseudomonas eucalypticola]|uniref:DUF4238 domain-containing protein n=1 Tax=Pseudomonas eucalypticola TaxID=2599595 RepID=A0A7D5HF96_9PSED|nr:DUF4238 domain-containing protein [Pseudomonas eucalypticola]QKZ06050.1 DUF4238 domain-containing protein [Pseudomonas eucalypticola]